MPSSSSSGGPPSAGIAGPNFRHSFISRLVADESGKLEQILDGDRDIDIFQLKQFVWKYSLPEKRRFEVWRLLLGVASGYPELRAIIEQHRREEAEVLWRGMATMRLAESKDVPMPSDLVRMILLANGDLGNNIDFRSMEVAPIVTIVHHMRIVVGFDRWRDAFCMARAAHSLFRDLFPDSTVKHVYEEVLRQTDVEKAGVQLSMSRVRLYLRSGGAVLFRSSRALQKLWDKLLSGGESPPFLMSQLLIQYIQYYSIRFGATSGHSEKEVVFPGGRLPEKDEVRLVTQAAEAVLRKPRIKDVHSSLLPLFTGIVPSSPSHNTAQPLHINVDAASTHFPLPPPDPLSPTAYHHGEPFSPTSSTSSPRPSLRRQHTLSGDHAPAMPLM